MRAIDALAHDLHRMNRAGGSSLSPPVQTFIWRLLRHHGWSVPRAALGDTRRLDVVVDAARWIQ